jgi:hypothetical protein
MIVRKESYFPLRDQGKELRDTPTDLFGLQAWEVETNKRLVLID